MGIGVGLGDLREYFAGELAKPRSVDEKRALRRYARSGPLPGWWCDVAEAREGHLDSVVRVSLDQMAQALQKADAGSYLFAVRMAKTSTQLDGRWRVLDGPLVHLALIAEDLASMRGRWMRQGA